MDRAIHFRLEILVIDAGEGFADVEIAGFALEAAAIPIEDAIGGVGILLDLVDEESGADGVEAAGGDEDRLAGSGSDGVDAIGDGPVPDGVLKHGAGDALPETDVEFRAGLTAGDVPHFRFRLAAEQCGEIGRRVDLDGEVVAGVEDLDEDGKAGVGIGVSAAENFLAAGIPQLVERGSRERAAVDDRLLVFAIDDLPGFAEGSVR